MNPKAWTFSIVWNEAKMLPWFIRHYSPWVERMVVFCEPSTDGTEEILKACPKVDLRVWPHKGLNDELFLETVNACYREARGKADWVAFVDPDELLFHPNMLSLLEKADGDIFPSTGYAMISTAWPDSKSDGQLYDHIRTGVRQDNYDKKLLFRPSLDVVHQHGRHSYPPDWPKHNGRECADVGIKLLHCHYVGGVDEVAARHRRNYARAVDKKFAWNFNAEHNNDPKQIGSLAWMQAALSENKLIDVFTGKPALKRLHFGCGGYKIAGWENMDSEVDIRKALPFHDGCASHVFCEHVVEHITHQQAWGFFEECYRVLAPEGIVRIAVPDMAKLGWFMTQEYQDAVKVGGHGDGSRKSTLKSVVFEHGHQAVWTQQLLLAFLDTVGFLVEPVKCGKSNHHELNDIEQHWKTVGRNIAEVETSVVEGTK